jgi:hypothetical protein
VKIRGGSASVATESETGTSMNYVTTGYFEADSVINETFAAFPFD